MNTLSYLNIITSEHRQKPKYIQMLTDVFDMYTNIGNQNNDITVLFDLDIATGDELDKIGEIIGQSRYLNYDISTGINYLDDEDYRFLLKSKIIQNSWQGTIEEIYSLWEQIFPNILLTIYDNQDMTCSIVFSGDISVNQYSLLTHDLLIPKPAGVQYTYAYLGQKWFSYNLDDAFHAGYNEGYWNGGISKIFALDLDDDAFGGLDIGEWLILV